MTKKADLRSRLQELLTAESQASDSGHHGDEDTDTDAGESQDLKAIPQSLPPIENEALNVDTQGDKYFLAHDDVTLAFVQAVYESLFITIVIDFYYYWKYFTLR